MDMTEITKSDPAEQPLTPRLQSIRRQELLQGITFPAVKAYLLLAVLVFVWVPFLAFSWSESPFIGAISGPGMEIKAVSSTLPESSWPAWNLGMRAGDRLVKVDGQNVSSVGDLASLMSSHAVGDQVMLTVRTPQSAHQDFQVQLIRFPGGDFIAYAVMPYLIGLVYLASGLWIFLTRRKLATSRPFTLFAASVSIVLAGIFDQLTTQRLQVLWPIVLGIAPGALLDLALRFPQEDRLILQFPFLKYLGYGCGVGLGIFTLVELNSANPAGYQSGQNALFIFSALALLVAAAWFLLRRFRASSPAEREHLQLLLVSGVISFGPLAAWIVTSPLIAQSNPFNPYLLLPLVVFPLTAAFSIQRYRLVHTDFILSRTLVLAMMGVLVACGYALLVTGVSLLLTEPATHDLPALVTGAIVFFLALAFSPVKDGLQKAVNTVFFRGRQVYEDRIQSFSSELTVTVDIAEILRVLRAYIKNSVQPSRMHIFIYDPLSEQYLAVVDESGRRTTDLSILATSPLAQLLNAQRRSLFMNSPEELPEDLKPEQARLSLLGANVFVPLPGRQRLAGWVALGSRLSGEAYTSREIAFIELLGDQAAVALERAQVVQTMENRVREMNVLARVAQGINITPVLDDILELIYAQTAQIIPSDDFHILLQDQATGELEEIFYVENNERYTKNENQPLNGNAFLEQEVIRQRRYILTDDYTQECQKRGIHANRTGLYAWAGVPLNAGAETIGAISAAKRDSLVTYTREQLNLLQAIADQAAGAIVKARLLQETERRARQLASLNEVSRQLTSTLDLNPLLDGILQNAVDILETDAGSLFLLDEQTGELVVKAATGPVAQELIGMRLPADVGVVGRAVNDRQVMVINEVTDRDDWYSVVDQRTGYTTRRLLAIPLLVKEDVIGAIEVVNKRDDSPFTRGDQDLLEAFARQAAMAIQNSRLFTSTDQALAARVEELSVMQRIDRELNTSLDTSRAMRITLEWALRQSNTDAGFVGIIMEQGLQVMASEGFDSILGESNENIIPIKRYGLDEVIFSGMAQQYRLEEASEKLLVSAQTRIVIPIRRETNTMGLLLLESTTSDAVTDDTLGFLARLSDHAAIAISNAQLYSAVQSANVAKSEFVSFVSHELKNPMTSIKGYTELLAAGAVGPINEMQSNFLATIRSNVERMSTLVSDLADVSRIEAGRLRLDFKATVLKDVVDEVVRSMRKQIDEKNQQLILQLPENLPEVWADRNRMMQVILNLVSNGYKYTPKEGQILVSAEATSNQWDPAGAPEVVHIWVKDSGIGIGPEDQAKIFQKFFRSEDPKTREAPGTGLGLNITRSLVEMQGGRIWFESEFRKGTTFHFTIPVAAKQ
jgi:signal transduction histidine kinase/putative methionine-R-sulfoxide reductase with GAF domain